MDNNFYSFYAKFYDTESGSYQMSDGIAPVGWYLTNSVYKPEKFSSTYDDRRGAYLGESTEDARKQFLSRWGTDWSGEEGPIENWGELDSDSIYELLWRMQTQNG